MAKRKINVILDEPLIPQYELIVLLAQEYVKWQKD